MDESQVITYMQSLNEDELLTIEIAKEILGDSFEIEKTIKFKSWVKTQVSVN